MKVLLDHNLPKELARKLTGHVAFTARQMGWDRISNGDLLAAAEGESFDVLLTADQSMYSQQNHHGRKVSLIVLGNSKLANIEPVLNEILAAIDRMSLGSYEFLPIPLPPKVRNVPGPV